MDVCAKENKHALENYRYLEIHDPERHAPFVLRRLTPDAIKLEMRQQASLGIVLAEQLSQHPLVLYATCMQPQPQEQIFLLHVRFKNKQTLADMFAVLFYAIRQLAETASQMQQAYESACMEQERNKE